MLERLGIYGMDAIEPIILTAVGLGLPIRLIGKPGTAKTKLAEAISCVENGREFARVFDCPTETIMTIAGSMDLDAAKKGVFDFIKKRPDGSYSDFIWSKTNLVFNEFTRMAPDTANMYLQVIQERTFFGYPLPIAKKSDPTEINYSIIATENPGGLGVRKMDSALLDRFYFSVIVPDFKNDVSKKVRKSLVLANITPDLHDSDGKDDVIANKFKAIRAAYRDLMTNASLNDNLADFWVDFWTTVNDLPDFVNTTNQPNEIRVSGRRQAMFSEAMLGIAAFNIASGMKTQAALISAIEPAIVYCITVPLGLEQRLASSIVAIGKKLSANLKTVMSQGERLIAKIKAAGRVSDKIELYKDSVDEIKQSLDKAQIEQVTGDILHDLTYYIRDNRSDVDIVEYIGKFRDAMEIVGDLVNMKDTTDLLFLDVLNQYIRKNVQISDSHIKKYADYQAISTTVKVIDNDWENPHTMGHIRALAHDIVSQFK